MQHQLMAKQPQQQHQQQISLQDSNAATITALTNQQNQSTQSWSKITTENKGKTTPAMEKMEREQTQIIV